MNSTMGTGHTKGSVRKIGALLCVAALGVAALTGCGGESSAGNDPAVASSTGAQPEKSAVESAETENSSRDGLPEGYPEDVPLPAFTTAHKVGGSAGDGFWVVLIELKEPTDTPVEDYAAQLVEAGYTVEDGSGGKEATGPKWDISFHSAMEGTLTISVI